MNKNDNLLDRIINKMRKHEEFTDKEIEYLAFLRRELYQLSEYYKNNRDDGR